MTIIQFPNKTNQTEEILVLDEEGNKRLKKELRKINIIDTIIKIIGIPLIVIINCYFFQPSTTGLVLYLLSVAYIACLVVPAYVDLCDKKIGPFREHAMLKEVLIFLEKEKKNDR